MDMELSRLLRRLFYLTPFHRPLDRLSAPSAAGEAAYRLRIPLAHHFRPQLQAAAIGGEMGNRRCPHNCSADAAF